MTTRKDIFNLSDYNIAPFPRFFSIIHAMPAQPSSFPEISSYRCLDKTFHVITINNQNPEVADNTRFFKIMGGDAALPFLCFLS